MTLLATEPSAPRIYPAHYRLRNPYPYRLIILLPQIDNPRLQTYNISFAEASEEAFSPIYLQK
jgi:hypothetical protein